MSILFPISSYPDTKNIVNQYKLLKEVEQEYKNFSENLGKFIFKYFPHWVDRDIETSRFRRNVHRKFENFLSTSKMMLVEAYRGAAKSTTFTEAGTLYQTLTKRRHYVIIISSTQQSANEELEKITNEISDNEKLRKDFQVGNVVSNAKNLYFTVGNGKKFREKTDLEKYLANQIRSGTPNAYIIREWKKSKAKDYKTFTGEFRRVKKLIEQEPWTVRIRAIGSNVKVRGTKFNHWRPDLVFVDDAENDENVRSKTQRDKLHDWFLKAIMKLPSRTYPHWNIIVVGTVLHYDGLIARIKKRKDVKNFSFPLVIRFPENLIDWEKLYKMEDREGAKKLYLSNRHFYKKGVLLDNPLIDLFEIMMSYFEDPDAFNTEFQNIATSSSSSLNRYQTYEKLPDDLIYFLAIDPSEGKQNGDYVGVSAVGRSPTTNRRYLVYAKGFHKTAIEIIDIIFQLHGQYSFKLVAIEKNMFPIYIQFIDKMARERNISIPLKAVHNKEKKEIRIETLAMDLELRNILINPEEKMWIQEASQYPKGENDDVIDSSALADRIAKNFYLGANLPAENRKPEATKKLKKLIKKRSV
jgi:predicted phage terminase large subunit-like protein